NLGGRGSAGSRNDRYGRGSAPLRPKFLDRKGNCDCVRSIRLGAPETSRIPATAAGHRSQADTSSRSWCGPHRGNECASAGSAMPESDASLSEVVRRHFDVDFIADTDADEIFSRFARNMSKYFVTVGQGDPEHSPGEDLRY